MGKPCTLRLKIREVKWLYAGLKDGYFYRGHMHRRFMEKLLKHIQRDAAPKEAANGPQD